VGICIIEPNQDDRLFFAAALNAAGYHEVTVFSSAADCLQSLGLTDDLQGARQFGVELIILGVGSPEDCVDTCRTIKSSFQYQDVPIIVGSGAAPADGIPVAIAYGANDYVRKPCHPQEFVARVRGALRLKYEIDRRKARERELLEATRQLADLNTTLTRLALIDPLTGIANRREFNRALDKEWRRGVRSKRSLGLIMIDIDYFKAYNDHYGHQSGDQCLIEVARQLKDALRRPGDVLARYGGEEFTVILPDTDLEGTRIVAENLRETVFAQHIPHLGSVKAKCVTISLGVGCCIPSDHIKAKDLIELADTALYQAKANGRNAVVAAMQSLEAPPMPSLPKGA